MDTRSQEPSHGPEERGSLQPAIHVHSQELCDSMISLIDDAYMVSKGNHILYSGLSATTLVLTGSLPSVPFRVAVSLLAATGHADVAGRVTVGSENLDFL